MDSLGPASTLLLLELGVIIALMLTLAAGRARRHARLKSIAALLERAADGDFMDAYDESTARADDPIADVGRAYNRVRGQLASLVLTDPLTACVNRRGFEQALVREIARAHRGGGEVALLALDIDHFKQVNDTLGHLVGDAVLRELGGVLLRVARAGDVVARVGGEEFSLILPDTSTHGAQQLATRLCEAVSSYVFRGEADGTILTVSIGVAASDMLPRNTRDVANVLKGRADQALYAAKRAGRDCVRAWAPQDEQFVLSSLL